MSDTTPTTEQQLRDALARLEEVMSAGDIATWTWDVASQRITADAAFARMFAIAPEDAASGDPSHFVQAIHPDDRARATSAIQRAMASQDRYETEFRVAQPDGSARWLVARGRVQRDRVGNAVALPGIVVDITEQVERGQRQQFLAEFTQRIQMLTDADAVIAEALSMVGQYLGVARCVFVDIDVETDNCYCHPDYRAEGSVPSMEGAFSIHAFGDVVTAEYAAGRAVAVDDVQNDPGQVPPESVAAYTALGIRAHASAPVVHSSRIVSCIGAHSLVPRHWKPEELELLQSVVERTWLTVEVIRQQQALAREAEQRRSAHERVASILQSVTDAFFALDLDWRFTYVNDQMERISRKTREELLGVSIWDAFPATVGSTFEYAYRRALSEQTSVSFEEFYPPLDVWLEVRAFPSKDGLSIFFQDVTARKREQLERERMLAEQSSRAERESLINQIGQSVRSSPDPDAVLETAVRELARALKADYCYYSAYDHGSNTAVVDPEWHRENLPSLAGPHDTSRFTLTYDPAYIQGATQIVSDTKGDAAFQELGITALVRVPLVSGVAKTALAVAMADGPREWTSGEVALVEAVATQTQVALEAARIRRKEHGIAQQFQAALQPVIPASVPGLAIGTYAKAALEESEIGGDFIDLFPLDKVLYAIVVGDVSGKGLAAAQQLALIRNSLRMMLYQHRTPSSAVDNLNAIVTSHDLLIGFVTAFVAVYDTTTGEFIYSSCGHESGLVRRVGGEVEELPTTGPPLGVDQNAAFEEGSITLQVGDDLLVYTDGLSEAGQNRKQLLGTAGLARLLAAIPNDVDAQFAAEAIVAGASEFAGGVFRDDVAVVLAQRV